MKRFKILDIIQDKYSKGMRIIKGERYAKDNHRAIQYHSGNEDYNPCDSTETLVSKIDNNNASQIVCLYKDGIARLSSRGEKRIYSTDENGSAVLAEIHFKNDGKIYIEATDQLDVEVGANCNVNIVGNANITVGGNVQADVTGNISANVGGNMTATVVGLLSFIASGISFLAQVTGSGIAKVEANCDEIDINVSGNTDITSSGNTKIESTGGTCEIKSSGKTTIDAPNVDIDTSGLQAIARVGDQVQIGSNIGTIITGSSKHRCG